MTKRKAGWFVGAAAFAAVPLLAHLEADAHVATGSATDWCSPHDANSSVKGSQFGNCWREGSSSTAKYHRTYWCASWSACGQALCDGFNACGHSYSQGSTSHGKQGGHAFNLEGWNYCTNQGQKGCFDE